jgi:hypothetical protein
MRLQPKTIPVSLVYQKKKNLRAGVLVVAALKKILSYQKMKRLFPLLVRVMSNW